MAWKKLNPKSIGKDNTAIFAEYKGKLAEAERIGKNLKTGLETEWKKKHPDRDCVFNVLNGTITYSFPKGGKTKSDGDDIF